MRGMSFLRAPSGRHRCYRLICRPPGHGRQKAIYAYRRADDSRRFQARVDALIASRANGDPPPVELARWIENLPAEKANRLVELGLLDQRRVEQTKPITEHVDDYETAVRGRRGNTADYARNRAAYVRAVVRALKVQRFEELQPHEITTLLDEWKGAGKASNTIRHYANALIDFGAWMVRDKRVAQSPLQHLTAPPADPEGEHIRRPLTVEQFRALVQHLDRLEAAGGYYPRQMSRWSAKDRKLIYWTAVCTAFRKAELASLRRRQLHLDENPASIEIRAKDAKNRLPASVPIPAELAEALATYVEDLNPEDRVFEFPRSSKIPAKALRKDLTEAGVELPDGEEDDEVIDFHALRSTAITWWLDEYELPQKRVQILARLQTLSLVAQYSRRFRIESFDWLERGPTLATDHYADHKTEKGKNAPENAA